MKNSCFLFVLLLSYLNVLNCDSLSFLERQKKLAEEQWKRDQERAERGIKESNEVEKEKEEEGEVIEYYYYYEGNEGEEEQKKKSDNNNPINPPIQPKKFGYQLSTTTLQRNIIPFTLLTIITEWKEKSLCLTELEIESEIDRVVYFPISLSRYSSKIIIIL